MDLLKNKINPAKLPQHVAIIMDGNGRWAKQKGKFRVFGHQNAITAVRDTVEGCAEIGIKYLTLYAFSTENWNRPKIEVNALMNLLVDSLTKELPTLQKNKIRLQSIGNQEQLPDNCRKKLNQCIAETAKNDHMTLVLALSYSAKWEMIEAVKKITELALDKKITSSDINENLISNSLSTAGMPDPELMIRTSGEHRISNFLLWQLAYAELYFTDKLWPDFTKNDLFEAILNFQNRERRFGLTSEQMKEKAK